MVFYPNPNMCGLNRVTSLGDGYTINMRWYQAYPSSKINKIAYHLYYSTNQEQVYNEGVKYVIIDSSVKEANIIDLTPGQEYWFSVRPLEYNPNIINFLSFLPTAYDNVKIYPNSILRQNMSATDLIVPLLDTENFLSQGFVRVGAELIQYVAVDNINDNLIIAPPGGAVPPSLVLQSNGKYYLPASANIGQGSINSLTLTGGVGNTETWTVKCAEVQLDNTGNPIAGTAIFQTFGSISGVSRDQYGNELKWKANGSVVANSIMSFSISETVVFQKGDYFTIQVLGSQPGVPGGRGYNGTPITIHNVNGFDGSHQWNPMVSMIAFPEDSSFDRIYACESRFEYPHFPFTMIDGYHQEMTDYLSTDYSAADAANAGFPMYDYAGYHRTDLTSLIDGTCVGTYIGGQQGCIDGYGNYNVYRGISMQDQNTQRQDLKLTLDGQPALLIQRVQTGITCSCYLINSEYQDDRCPFCFGTKFVLGYEQYFNPRYSDGRIRVRLSPTNESLKMYEAGLESEFPLQMWTLTVPTIKMRDVIVLFDQNDNESFRYEVGAVTRNQTFIGLDGGQMLNTFRIRKTDPVYQIPIFRNTADFPKTLNTSLGFAPGLPPHSHTIVTNEKTLSVSQINQLTGVSLGHNHEIIKGVVQETLGHLHTIILV